MTYPASCGRNFNEILRIVDSLQLTHNKSLATPANWVKGDKCVILPGVTKEVADVKFEGYETVALPSGKPYLRMTDKTDWKYPLNSKSSRNIFIIL